MYGQTEATARMSCLQWKFLKKKIGSIGKPLENGKFFIYDNKNKLIKKSNTVGHLVYKGNNVMLGYAENIKDLNKGDVNEKILFTGDLAKKDKDGFYYITGRKSRYIKMFGLRLSLDEIEQEIKNLGIDCACLGDDNNLKVFITDRKKKKTLVEYFGKKLSINIKNISINKVLKIPRNRDGKILYSGLEKLKLN